MRVKRDKINLTRSAKRLLAKHGLHWRSIFSEAQEIVVFGSSAISHPAAADLDLLIIGAGRRFKGSDLDVVSKPVSALKSRVWLGSELANHVARYGIWLKGCGEWRSKIYVSDAAISFKRRLIRSRARSLTRAWSNLYAPYRAKHVVKLRRDLQRLQYLSKSIPVPPSPILDSEWQKKTNDISGLTVFAFKAKLLTAKQIKIFSPHWKLNSMANLPHFCP